MIIKNRHTSFSVQEYARIIVFAASPLFPYLCLLYWRKLSCQCFSRTHFITMNILLWWQQDSAYYPHFTPWTTRTIFSLRRTRWFNLERNSTNNRSCFLLSFLALILVSPSEAVIFTFSECAYKIDTHTKRSSRPQTQQKIGNVCWGSIYFKKRSQGHGSILEHDGKMLSYNCQHGLVKIMESGQPFWATLNTFDTDCGCPGQFPGVNVWNCVKQGASKRKEKNCF